MRISQAVLPSVVVLLLSASCGGGDDSSGSGDGDSTGDGDGDMGDGDLGDGDGDGGDGDGDGGDGDGDTGGQTGDGDGDVAGDGDGDLGGMGGGDGDAATGGIVETPTYLIGGTISAGAPAGVTVQLGDEVLQLGADPGAFSFSTELLAGQEYEVVLVHNAGNSRCTISGATGTVEEADVEDIEIACSPIDYSGYFTARALPVDSDDDQQGDAELPGMFQPGMASADVDDDGDQDFLLSGYHTAASRSEVLLYLNEGGLLEPVALPVDTTGDSTGDEVFARAASFAVPSFGEATGDSYPELLITGTLENGDPAGVVYHNQSGGLFREIALPMDINEDKVGDSPLTGSDGFGRLGALVSEGPADIFLMGRPGIGAAGVASYLKLTANLTWAGAEPLIDDNDDMEPTRGLVDVRGWADFAEQNGDGIRDFAMMGGGQDGTLGALYLSNGAGSYVEHATPIDTDEDGVGDAPIPGSSQIFFADLDRDGMMDLLTENAVFRRVSTAVFREIATPHDTNGDGTGDAALPQFTQARFAVHDIDNDGDDDWIRLGYMGERSTQLFINNGDGSFVIAATSIPDMDSAAAHFIDLDGDGDRDLIVSGRSGATTYVTQVFDANY